MVLLASRRSFVPLHIGRFVLLALGGLLVGHQAVYVAQYGEGAALGQAMTASGHDGYWSAFTTVALSGLLLLLLRSAWRLVELRRDATGPALQAPEHGRPSAYGRELLRLWPPLFGTVAVAYLVQENIEHLVAQGHLAGFSPLVGLQAPLALPILGLVTLAFAIAGALVRWRTALLEARARAAREPTRRFARRADRRSTSWALVGAIRATFWSLARQGPVRAPPSDFA
ncbi:MAG TPA: hypothetical protein VID25_06355 [Candidatus Limnocylindrales bacterium]|jgi:hypothetical protein